MILYNNLNETKITDDRTFKEIIKPEKTLKNERITLTDCGREGKDTVKAFKDNFEKFIENPKPYSYIFPDSGKNHILIKILPNMLAFLKLKN